MSGTIAMSGRRLALTVAWSRAPRRAEAGMPATVAPVTPPPPPPPLTFTERARAAGQARAASMTADERAESARNAANAAHRPAALARRIVKAWPALSRAERAELREILREGKVIS